MPDHASVMKLWPGSRLVRRSRGELAGVRAKFPGIPPAYWRFLETVGGGTIGDSHYLLFDEPMSVLEFGESPFRDDFHVIGDDFSEGIDGFFRNEPYVVTMRKSRLDDGAIIAHYLGRKRSFEDFIGKILQRQN